MGVCCNKTDTTKVIAINPKYKGGHCNYPIYHISQVFWSLPPSLPPVKRESRDRLSGAVEAFARKNGSSSGIGLHGDHSRHRSSDIPSSKEVVRIYQEKFVYIYFLNLYCQIIIAYFNFGFW